jgi:hypothetical protein
MATYHQYSFPSFYPQQPHTEQSHPEMHNPTARTGIIYPGAQQYQQPQQLQQPQHPSRSISPPQYYQPYPMALPHQAGLANLHLDRNLNHSHYHMDIQNNGHIQQPTNGHNGHYMNQYEYNDSPVISHDPHAGSVSPDHMDHNHTPEISSSGSKTVTKWKDGKDGPVKNACLSCRTKKAKCDGVKPICGQVSFINT